ncbi:MAG: gamma-glutamyltransferase [Thermomicrobia bacterium]|nr:gamma-glutamyltransferase [Thermomicrobia bacterium]
MTRQSNGSGPARVSDLPFHARGPGERRGVAIGRGGMVATAHPLATAAGLWALERGGNAMDAAIAAAGVCAVVLPASCGLGGDCFLLYYDAKTQKVTGVNGSGAAPRTATPARYQERGHISRMPGRGPLSVGVPGAVDAWFTAFERWGSIRWSDLLRPAEQYARNGFALTPHLAAMIGESADMLKAQAGGGAKTLLKGGKHAPHTGQILKNGDLADAISLLRRQGRDAFYAGELAEKIAAWMAKNDGLITQEDLAAYTTDVYPAISTTYRDYTVYTTAPPSQGLILLQELNILANADIAAMDPQGAAALHLMIEAKKLAFADRNRYAGDPNFVTFPLDKLISPERGASHFVSIDAAHARVDDPALSLIPEMVGDTTSLCTMDQEGNAVSLIHSLSAAFGSGCVVDGTGIFLNNRAGRGFSLQPGHPNILAPGKRTMHTLHCYAVTRKDGTLAFVGGTPGGDQQPQWNMQVITNILDYGMSPQEAIEAPRWTSFPGRGAGDRLGRRHLLWWLRSPR